MKAWILWATLAGPVFTLCGTLAWYATHGGTAAHGIPL